MMKHSEMYYAGYEHGADRAINCCFGGSKMTAPRFETEAEERDYWDGYDRGYSSVD